MRQPRKTRNSTWYRLLLLSSVAAVGAYYLLSSSSLGQERHVIIKRGSSAAMVADTLYRQDIIGSPAAFRLLLRVTGGHKRVHAGEFAFNTGSGMLSALYTLYYSKPILHQVTIPEGWSVRQIAPILARAGLVEPAKFIELALDPQTAKKYQLNSPSLEGYLYPDTYRLSRVDGEAAIIDHMVRNFFSKYTDQIQARAAEIGMTREQVVTLASIVEKETGVDSEKPTIASVFHNRLKKHMRLQSDPTTIYAITNFNGNLTKKDLQTYTPYNTYKIPALPPGPIANPGIDAIKAVLYPADTDYLYFVANNQGAHIFSATYKQHNQYVDRYQRSNASRRATERVPLQTRR